MGRTEDDQSPVYYNDQSDDQPDQQYVPETPHPPPQQPPQPQPHTYYTQEKPEDSSNAPENTTQVQIQFQYQTPQPQPQPQPQQHNMAAPTYPTHASPQQHNMAAPTYPTHAPPPQPMAFPPQSQGPPPNVAQSQGPPPQGWSTPARSYPPQANPQAYPPQPQVQAQAFPPAQGGVGFYQQQQVQSMGGYQTMPRSPMNLQAQQMNCAAMGTPVEMQPKVGAYQAQVADATGWSTGLFDCMDDPNNAIITACFPCVTFGQIAEIVDNGHTSCGTSGLLYGLIAAFIGIPCIMSCTYRTKLRSQYGLIESPGPDWVTHLFFEWCALCQEYRELQHRGLDPSIGWMGNVARNQKMQQQQVAMTPPMNQAMNMG